MYHAIKRKRQQEFMLAKVDLPPPIMGHTPIGHWSIGW